MYRIGSERLGQRERRLEERILLASRCSTGPEITARGNFRASGRAVAETAMRIVSDDLTWD